MGYYNNIMAAYFLDQYTAILNDSLKAVHAMCERVAVKQFESNLCYVRELEKELANDVYSYEELPVVDIDGLKDIAKIEK